MFFIELIISDTFYEKNLKTNMKTTNEQNDTSKHNYENQRKVPFNESFLGQKETDDINQKIVKS